MSTHSTHEELVEVLDELLPQTQCGLCEYPACRPYAEAIANQEASINRCIPGGVETRLALAHHLMIRLVIRFVRY